MRALLKNLFILNFKYLNYMRKILTKNNNFKKILEKKIWALGTLSGMSAVDILFKRQ